MTKPRRATPIVGLQKLNANSLTHLNDKYAVGYRFGSKDMIIDQIVSLMEIRGVTASQIAKEGYISVGTIYNWQKGKTKRPQNASIEAALRAMGLTREIVEFKLRMVENGK